MAIEDIVEYTKNLKEKQKDPNYKKKVENMMEKAKDILEEMRKRKFKEEREAAEKELE